MPAARYSPLATFCGTACWLGPVTHMKRILIALLSCSIVSLAGAAQHRQLVRKWETKPELKTPESVLYDAGAGLLYVSNVDGREAWTKDGKGSIAKIGLDGSVIAAEWVTGLNAPKGLGLHGGRLYAADIDVIAVIDVAKAAIVQTISVPGAQQLNDITISPDGVVYVSDSKARKIHAITDGKPAVWLENLKGPNGVLYAGGVLYVLDRGALLRVEKDRSLTTLVDGMEGDTDGVEQVQGDEFVVSCWRGKIYSVQGGEKQLLLDTQSKGVESADIGYDAQNRIVYVPTFFTNTVVAYELK